MTVDTGEFRALSDEAASVDEYRRSLTVLIKAVAWFIGEQPDPPERPQLRLIEGGRQ